MIGYYRILSSTVQNMSNIDKNGIATIYPISYAGGCCMGITGIVPPAFPEVRILVPYRSQDDGYKEVVLTLKEITSWVNFINELGIKCSIVNEELITYIDSRNSGVFCEISVTKPDKQNNKYNLIVLTLLRYMFNTTFRYREIYENALVINRLLPDIDPVVRLSIAHKLVMTNVINANCTRIETNIYSGYYGLFIHDWRRRFLTSKTLAKGLAKVAENINIVFENAAIEPKSNVEMLPENLAKLIHNPTEENLTILRDIIKRNSY